MKTSPKISLGMPVYNGEKHLSAAIDSILGQSFGDFELLISDNKSTDSTAEICRDFANRDRRVRLVTQAENIGAAPNFNCVFYNSSGTYFKWCAHDDLLETTFLEKTYERLENDPNAVLAHSYTKILPDEKSVTEIYRPVFEMPSNAPSTRLGEVMIRGRRCYEVFGLIRRNALRRSSLIGNHKGGDNVLLYRLALLGTFAIVPEPLFVSRIHEAQSINLLTNNQGYHAWFTGQVKRYSFPDWHYLYNAWKTPSGIGLTLDQRFKCYRALASETWRMLPSLRQNVRVVAETFLFGYSDPRRRRRLFTGSRSL